MKKFLYGLVVMVALSVQTLFAANAQTHSIIGSPAVTVNGTNSWDTMYNTSVSLYSPTGQTTSSSTFVMSVGEAYTTNVVVTNVVAKTTNSLAVNTNTLYWVYPLSTNSASGGLYPLASQHAMLWANSNGDIASPAVSLTFQGTTTATNTMTLNFIRSVDGSNYDTNTVFSFVVTPSTTPATIITNLPAPFITAAQKVRLLSIVTATNTSSSTYNIYHLGISGYVP